MFYKPQPCLGTHQRSTQSASCQKDPMGRRESTQPNCKQCYSALSSKTSLPDQVHAVSPWLCCTCYTHISSHILILLLLSIFSDCFIYFGSLLLLMTFSLSFCRVKTKTTSHKPESSRHLFTFKMLSVQQSINYEDASVFSTSNGSSLFPFLIMGVMFALFQSM